MKLPMIIAALIASGPGDTMSHLAHAEPVEMAHKEAVTDELGEGEVRDFADGSQMVGADYFTVYVEGEGPDVLLIPGLSTPRVVWDRTREQLKDRFRVHSVQTRGFGDQPPTATLAPERRSLLDTYAFHLADYIDDYLIDAMDGTNPAIIGHSMGGLVAMKIAANMEHQVDRIMVVDSLPFFGLIFSPVATSESMAAPASTIRDALAAKETGETDSQSLQMMSVTEAGREQVRLWSQSTDAETLAAYFHDVMITDVRPEVARLKLPMTVLYPVDNVERTEAVYQSVYGDAAHVTLQRIDGSRHFIMLDQPQKFAASVEQFLQSHDGNDM